VPRAGEQPAAEQEPANHQATADHAPALPARPSECSTVELGKLADGAITGQLPGRCRPVVDDRL
jgi:hypothetical protein